VTIIHLQMVDPDDSRQASQTAQAEGQVLWVPVKVGHHLPRAAAGRAQAQAITGPVLAALRAADVVFAHVTMPAGVAVSGHLETSQRLILVEHASYLPQLLARPEARLMYGEAVARADAVLTAGQTTAALIRGTFPQARRKVWAVGNPVDLEAFPYLARPPDRPLERWIYVGNLLEAKGVFAVLDGFAAVGAGHLTLVGDGPDRARLEARSERLGLADRVTFLGALAGPDVAAAMASADLQVHLSPGETFGLAPLEGLASGLPLVVARNDGTVQTMGPALAAGRAVMIEPPSGHRGALKVAAAVERLQWLLAKAGDAAGNAASAEPGMAVRNAIKRRYGMAQFGAMERRVAAGLAPFDQPALDAPLSLVVVLTVAAWAGVAHQVDNRLAAGNRVRVVFINPALESYFDPRAEAHLVADPHPGVAVMARSIGAVLDVPLALAVRLAARIQPRCSRLVAVRARLRGWRDRSLEPAVRRLWCGRSSTARLVAAVIQESGQTARSGSGLEIITAPPDPARLRAALRNLSG
jgi:glycosyltransferase involved in cell wall biosynthesis